MGNNSPSNDGVRQITSLSNLPPQFDQNQQYIIRDQCCWIQFSKVSIQKLIWQTKIMIKLKQLKKDKMNNNFQWIDQLIIFFQKGNKVYPRIPFIKQVNQIKYAKNIKLVQKEQKQALLSDKEIQKFKSNLKKSILISFVQPNNNMTQQYKQKQKKINVYTSFAGSNHTYSINNTNNKQQQIQLPQNKINKKNSTSMMAKSMIYTKKNKIQKNMYAQHFRKSILKQRQRQKSSYNSNNSSKINSKGSVMSFFDDTIASMLKNNNLNEISKQSACLLQCFIKLTMIIQSHFRNQSFIFTKIKQIYKKNILQKYQPYLKDCQQLSQQILQNCIDSIKIFIQIITDGIYQYYNLSNFKNPIQKQQQNKDKDKNQFKNKNILNPLISNYQNILVLITSLIFKDQAIYNLLFSLIKKYNNQKQNKFQIILNNYQRVNIGPQYFQIKPQYCLNNYTLKSFMKVQSISVGSKIQNLQLSDLQSQISYNNNINNNTNTNYNKQKIPYKQCIDTLKKLQNTKTPISKLKIILQCAQLITKTIEKYYIQNSIKIEINNQVLDADQILSIFCYLVVKSQVKDIYSHMLILEHFTTDHQLISITGYYYSVLACAIEQLEKNTQRSLQVDFSQHLDNSLNQKIINGEGKKYKNFDIMQNLKQKKNHISMIMQGLQDQTKIN